MVMLVETKSKAEAKVEAQKMSPIAAMAEGGRRDVAYLPW